MAADPEIEAMASLSSALEPLDEAARGRVLEWAAKRYGVTLASRRNGPSKTFKDGIDEPEDEPDEVTDDQGGVDSEVFNDFADLYDAANPQSEAERTLVGAYWFQVVQDEGIFKGYSVNEALRNMGHEVSNITRACDGLKSSEPALVRQMTKSGKSRQARKTYKLTNAGMKAVEAMLE